MKVNPFSLSCLILAITTFSIILMTVFYGRRIVLHRIWALFNIAVFVWAAGAFIVSQTTDLPILIPVWKITILGVIFSPIFLFHTVYVLCGLTNKKILILVYFQGILASIADAMGFLTHLKYMFNSFYYPVSVGYAYPLLYFTWLIIVSYAHYELYWHYRKASGIKRNQLLYFFISTIIGFIGAAMNFFPVLGIKIYPYSNFLPAIYCGIATYALFRYRLMDISIAVTRTGIFVVVYTLVLGLPFAFALWLRVWLSEVFGVYWWTVPLGLMAILSTSGPFVYIYLQRKAEASLLKEQKRYQETLKQASVGMTRIRNLRRLLDLITHIVTKTVKISYAAIYLYDQETNKYILQVSRDKGRIPIPHLTPDNFMITWVTLKRESLIYEEIKRQMEDTNDPSFKNLEENMRLLTASVIIPSFLEDRLLGFIVLGDKVSGQIYTPDDLSVFQVLASQAALAIENAQFYEEAKKMQEQVAQAEKMATIGTMADGLSHQINNRFYALSLIAGDSIDTIKLTDTSKCTPEVKQMIEEINHALERIQSNVIQGGEVVRGLLKYSRKDDTGFEALELNKILDSTIEMVQFKVKLSEVDIVRNFSSDIPKIHGNMAQLQEAFFNFIDNAYDAIVERRTLLKEEGYRGKITIAAQARDNKLEILVEDNGIGIKDANNDKVFTPFFTTKTSSRKGTGLGLYVIKRIVEDMHKGRIIFESDYKLGTRFIIELPTATS